MMDLLGIKTLRPGASGDANAPNAANYDESKADVYTNLPDPLVMKNGEKVTSATDVVGASGGRRSRRISIARFWGALRRICPR